MASRTKIDKRKIRFFKNFFWDINMAKKKMKKEKPSPTVHDDMVTKMGSGSH